ncbi:MAG: hypothetical protein DHS20C18_40820 [Saprospiraceae bacterium]|nr:MAG: hypothetical protein DHS20C18_40820 [Saprospiraceae bacterium]
MKQHFNTYALIYDLDRWIPNFGSSILPGWILDDSKWLDPFLEKAEKIVLDGKPIKFDPQHPVQLESIFNHLKVKEKSSNLETKHFPFQPLSLDKEDIFPTNDHGSFKELCEGFIQDFTRLPGGAGEEQIFGETLYYLLKKYCSCIPVSEEVQYIQLFEFLKIRAAIALSLFYHNQAKEQTQEVPFLLYCVDQSGIQNFIYNITSNRASKSLKGRSFYLHLLMETIKQKIFNHADIPAGMLNVLYASGGKMYLILPNTIKVNNGLTSIEADLLEQLFGVHKTELYLSTGRLPFGRAANSWRFLDEKGEWTSANTGALWSELAKITRKSGTQPFKNLISANFENFFLPNEDDGFDTSEGTKKVCAVTGETIAIPNENDKKYREIFDMSYHPKNKDEDNSERIWVTKAVKRQAELGYKLQWSKYYKTFYTEKNISKEHKKRLFSPLNVEVYHGMAEENDIKDEYGKFGSLPSFTYSVVQKINDPIRFLPGEDHNIPQGEHSAYGFAFYGGNIQAYNPKMREDERDFRKAVKDYSQLTGIESEEDKHKGFHRLGVLRMDVDGLGEIFTAGMEHLSSITAYATLSSQLDLFFSGYLNTIRTEVSGGNEYLNIIYSGGDDIFALGRWDVALTFAERIRADFKEFVNGREEISISGGLALIGPKFPIAKAADMAGHAEDEAKDYPKYSKDKKKNAICFLELPISWDKEYNEVKRLKNDMIKLYNQGELTSGFLQRMMVFQMVKDLHLNEIGKSKKPDLSFLWTSAYFISRYQGRFKKKSKDAPIHLFLENIKLKFFTAVNDNARFYDLIALASRWAELEIRSSIDS